MSDKKKTCFIITPIGGDNSDIRRHIDGIIDQSIKPAIGNQYEISVSHRDFEIGSINNRIVKRVYESDLVIANLTNTNPNVMYELAIRHCSGKPTIVIAEKGTMLPFDVIDENTIFYVNDPSGANELKDKICETEKKINFSKNDYGPVCKAINKIPLYNEVESGAVTGEDVSSGKMMQYIIDRLDAIEKNISLGKQNIVEKTSTKTEYYRLYFTNVDKNIRKAIDDKVTNLSNTYEDVYIMSGPNNGNIEIYIDGKEQNVNKILSEIGIWAKEKNLVYQKIKYVI